jgi:DHA1 family bicyclomycin/chloramphenicol resistance-like MFS transporter
MNVGRVARDISRAEFIALVASFTAINAAAIDVMLPALPYMGEAFQVENANDRSLVLTVFLIGLGLPQLLIGPVTDRFGRRAPLLIGLTVYTIAAFAALVVTSFAALLFLRFAQGLGSAAVAVSSQASVRDRYSGSAMAEVMSLVLTVFMIVPIVAPFVGQFILLTGPWQLIFVFMGVLGIVFTTWSFLRLPESIHAEDRRPLEFRPLIQGFGFVFRNRSSLAYGTAGMFMFGSVLGLVNTSQQIYVDVYGVGALFPLAFGVMPVAFGVAFFLNSRIVKRTGMRRLAHGAMTAFVVITALWLLFTATTGLPLWLFLAFVAGAALTQGLAWGNIGALVMEPLGHVAGTASAVFGSLSTVGGAVLAYVVQQSFDGTPTPVVAAFFIFGLCVIGCFLIAEKGRLYRHGRPGPAAADRA